MLPKRTQCSFLIQPCTCQLRFVSSWCSSLKCNKCSTFLKHRTTIMRQSIFNFAWFCLRTFITQFCFKRFSSCQSFNDFYHMELRRHKIIWPGYEGTFSNLNLGSRFFFWLFYELFSICCELISTKVVLPTFWFSEGECRFARKQPLRDILKFSSKIIEKYLCRNLFLVVWQASLMLLS